MSQLNFYNRINRSFKKRLVFNLGSEMGFYSEFNNMVFAILYCLKYKYRFVLYSANANFKFKDGWEDYFEKFTNSTRCVFHAKYNRRIRKPYLSRRDYLFWYPFRTFFKNTFLTFELWDKFYNADFEKETFSFSKLEINGDLREASRRIVNMIYRFNENTKKELEKKAYDLNLPKKYGAINIRRGDKDTEWKFIETSKYIEKFREVSELKSVFVLTDDYDVITELKQNYPGFTFYTLCEPDENGYVHEEFLNLDINERKRKMLNLFTSMEIICNADCFIGAYTTNVGLFIGMRMPADKVISIQKSSWFQFEVDDVTQYIVTA